MGCGGGKGQTLLCCPGGSLSDDMKERVSGSPVMKASSLLCGAVTPSRHAEMWWRKGVTNTASKCLNLELSGKRRRKGI